MKESIEAYRQHYQSMHVSAHYSGRAHFALVLISACLLIALIVMFFPGAPTSADWMSVPATLLVASFVEYWAHRGPMHHPVRGLRAIYRRHALRHHRYFVPGDMHLRDDRDFHVVLFPPLLLGFFALIAVALGTMIAWLTTLAAGALFAATSVAYYLAYELLHLSYHSQRRRTGWGSRWLAALTRHHALHHDPRLMLHCNFNLVIPVFDWMLNTLRTDSPDTYSADQHAASNGVAHSDDLET